MFGRGISYPWLGLSSHNTYLQCLWNTGLVGLVLLVALFILFFKKYCAKKSKDLATGYLPQQTQIQKDFPISVYEVVLSGFVKKKGFRPFYSKDMKTLYTYFQNNGYCSKFVVPETVETIERNAFFYNCDDPILYGDITFTKNVKNFDLSQFTSSDDGFGAKMCQGTITIDSPYLYEQLISNPDYKLVFGGAPGGVGTPFYSVHAIKVLKTIDTDTTNNYFNAEDVNKDTTTDTLYNIYTVS